MDKVYELASHFCENKGEEVLTARLPDQPKAICLCAEACKKSCEYSEKAPSEDKTGKA